jgi:hypothetical protein
MLLTRLSWAMQDAAEELGQEFWFLQRSDPEVRAQVLQHFRRRYPQTFTQAEVETALEEAGFQAVTLPHRAGAASA